MTRRSEKQGKKSAAIPKRDIHNKSELDARQRQAQAKRREKVAALYHAGYKQEEIADKLKIAQSTVSQDLSYLREKWTQAATAIIGDWIARELAYAVEQRDAVLDQWREDRNPRHAQVVLAWSKRVAEMLGLDAPDKVEDWTAKDWREYAQANGLNEADAIAEAEAIIREAKAGVVVLPAGDSATPSDQTSGGSQAGIPGQ